MKHKGLLVHRRCASLLDLQLSHRPSLMDFEGVLKALKSRSIRRLDPARPERRDRVFESLCNGLGA